MRASLRVLTGVLPRLLLLCWLASCRPGEGEDLPPGPGTGSEYLPEVAGFSAGPVERGGTYQRRTYSRGQASLQVTVVESRITADHYRGWVEASAAFPQVPLPMAPSAGNGFYQCTFDGRSCDLLVQLRSGVHVEIRSSGTAPRALADGLARGLPWGRMARGQ